MYSKKEDQTIIKNYFKEAEMLRVMRKDQRSIDLALPLMNPTLHTLDLEVTHWAQPSNHKDSIG